MEKQIRIIRNRRGGINPIGNTKRVERVLNIIKFLKEFKSIKEIASHLKIHEKSVNRYLNLLVQLGFNVEVGHKKYSYFRISNTKEFFEIK